MRRYRVSLQGSRLIEGRLRAHPVPSTSDWRDKYDVVIVGGGIVGACAALFLAERGVDVVLLEKGQVAAEASGRAVGFIDSVLMSPAKQEAIVHARQLWSDLDRRCGAVTTFHQGGLIFALRSQQEIEAAETWIAAQRATTDARLLDAAATYSLLPQLARTGRGPFVGALYAPSDGYADPRHAVPAIASGAARKGATIIQNCAVRRILIDAGKVLGVETERGIIRSEHVVVAAGIWSSLLLRPHGIDVPQLYGFATATEVHADGLPQNLAGGAGGVSFRPTPEGSHVVGPHLSLAPITPAGLRNALKFRQTLRHLGKVIDFAPSLSHFLMMQAAERWRGEGESPFEKYRILEPEYRRYSEQDALLGVAAAFDLHGAVQLRESWAGALATTPDNMPIIGCVPDVRGLYLACGMYYGFTFGPAAASLVAAQILGEDPPFDGHLYRPSRFHDGSKLAFHQ